MKDQAAPFQTRTVLSLQTPNTFKNSRHRSTTLVRQFFQLVMFLLCSRTDWPTGSSKTTKARRLHLWFLYSSLKASLPQLPQATPWVRSFPLLIFFRPAAFSLSRSFSLSYKPCPGTSSDALIFFSTPSFTASRRRERPNVTSPYLPVKLLACHG